MAEPGPVRSFGGSRRGHEPPKDEFPDRVVLPAMVLKPVELPVVLTVDNKVLEETVQLVYDAFKAAAKAGIEAAVAEIATDYGVPAPVGPPEGGRPDDGPEPAEDPA